MCDWGKVEVGSAFVGARCMKWGRCVLTGRLLSLSLGSWNEGMGETGRKQKVRTIPTTSEQVKVA